MLLNLFNSSKNSSYTVAIADDALMQVVMDQVLETFPRHNLSLPEQSRAAVTSQPDGCPPQCEQSLSSNVTYKIK